MEIVSKKGHSGAAEVFVAKVGREKDDLIEFVDAVDPRFARGEKWVVIVSTQIGCPVSCPMCDSGKFFKRNLTRDEILSQIDYAVRRWHPDGKVDCAKFKVQFARMGEPSYNSEVLEVLKELSEIYDAPGLIPCVATVMPKGNEEWFEELREVVHNAYSPGHFQLQISINSTDESVRDRLIPIKKWGFDEINSYGEEFCRLGDRKIGLNFALPKGVSFDTGVLTSHFNPRYFLVKLTPVNPTDAACENGLETVISNNNQNALDGLAEEIESIGYDCIISIGSKDEVEIGSNCGQAVKSRLSLYRC